MSFKKFLGGRAVFDPHAMRARFPAAWARWLRGQYRSSVQIADAFGVSDQTARNWLDETSRPTGDKVALVLSDPESCAQLTAEIGRAA